MGSIERRIQQLEELYHTSPEDNNPEEREERRAVMLDRLQRGREKAEREEAEGDPRRRIALDNLEHSMRGRSGGA